MTPCQQTCSDFFDQCSARCSATDDNCFDGCRSLRKQCMDSCDIPDSNTTTTTTGSTSTAATPAVRIWPIQERERLEHSWGMPDLTQICPRLSSLTRGEVGEERKGKGNSTGQTAAGQFDASELRSLVVEGDPQGAAKQWAIVPVGEELVTRGARGNALCFSKITYGDSASRAAKFRRHV